MIQAKCYMLKMMYVFGNRAIKAVKIQCPHCGQLVESHIIEQKRLNHTVKIVYDALRQYHIVTAAAKKINCSQIYIYKILKEAGLTVNGVKR